MKLIFTFLSVVLFWSRFWICKWKYPKAFPEHVNYDPMDADKFADLSYSFFAIFGLLCWINSILPNGSEKYWIRIVILFLVCFGIGLSISDVLDRFCFDIIEYTKADKTMLVLNLTASLIICKIRSEKIKNDLFNLNATQNGRCT